MRKNLLPISHVDARRNEQEAFKARVRELFFGPTKNTVKEIAQKEGVTRQRIYQILKERKPQ